MADSFSKREKGEELKYEMDQELLFKAESRRNKLLGLWLAEVFGLTGDDANNYAKEVVVADLDEPGHEDVVRKVMSDIQARNAPVTEEQVRKKIQDLESVALDQVKNEV
ncbi:MAG: DUF1476 domain-containing protein [Rhodospirillales bacterium]|nr:DUF1476 domain-containing protein [Rhodospirillales bacterium]MBO6788059.1 DUF1476 domain-containing protein [Rhodospirillales bacterium]